MLKISRGVAITISLYFLFLLACPTLIGLSAYLDSYWVLILGIILYFITGVFLCQQESKIK
jgi:hypothetical protein